MGMLTTRIDLTKIYDKFFEIKKKEKILKRKLKSLERLKYLYKNGFIDEKEYITVKNSLIKDIEKIKFEILERIGSIREDIDEIKKLINFNKEVKRIYKPIIQINPEEEKKIERIEIDLKKLEEVLKPRNVQVELSKRVPIVERKEEKREKTKIPKIKPKRIVKKKEINYTKELLRIINKYFGKFSDFISNNFPEVYKFVYEMLKKSGVRMTVRSYLSTLISTIFLSSIPALIFSLLFFKDVLYAILFLILTISFVFLIFIYYPSYVKKQKEQNIKSVLPFAIVHMASLARSGISPVSIFKVIAETKEYKDLAEEFKRIVEYSENLGLGLSDAIKKVADTTVSQDLKEFLEGLLLALHSGSSLREYLEVSAESAIIHYKSQNEKFIQAIKTFSDIYVGMVITMPIILVSVIIMLASLAERVFGLPIPLLTIVLVYLVVPAVNIIMILLISKIQPK